MQHLSATLKVVAPRKVKFFPTTLLSALARIKKSAIHQCNELKITQFIAHGAIIAEFCTSLAHQGITMKKLLPLIVTASLLSTTSFHSVAEVTANVAASSNYFWRGQTQTKDGSAVSGGIDYNDDSGFYAGTWVSNVDFGNKTSYELDLYAGFTGTQGDLGYDVGYIHYAYPDASGSSDFGELYGALSWQWLSFKASYLTHAQEDQSTEEEMLYLELGASFTILNETELAFHIGQSSGDTVMEWTGEDDSYMDYGVSIAKNGFTLGFVKTDLDADDDIKAYVSYGLDFEL